MLHVALLDLIHVDQERMIEVVQFVMTEVRLRQQVPEPVPDMVVLTIGLVIDMRKLILFCGVALTISCTPKKSGQFVRLDMYCDSCKVSVKSWWYRGNDSGSEVAYSGIIDNYQSINVERFDSDVPCVRLSEYINYGSDTIDIFFIENTDTIAHDVGATGYCN